MDTSYRVIQGSLVLAGTGAVATGIGFISNGGRTVDGLILVAIGAAIVYWRELRK
jgi:hypothetical protein